MKPKFQSWSSRRRRTTDSTRSSSTRWPAAMMRFTWAPSLVRCWTFHRKRSPTLMCSRFRSSASNFACVPLPLPWIPMMTYLRMQLPSDVAFRDPGLAVNWWSFVGAFLAGRQLDGLVGDLLVGNQAQQVRDQVQAGAFLVVGVHHVPWGLLDVRERKHLVFGLGIVHPARPGLEVHGAQLPAFARVVDTLEEAPFLFLVTERHPVLDEHDARVDQGSLDLRACPQEFVVFVGGAEAHDALDAGPVVPAAVEQHDLTSRGQMRDVSLEVPLALLPLRRGPEGDHPGVAGIEPLHDPLDGAAFARRAAALEKHAEPQAFVDDPLLHLHELGLEAAEFGVVELGGHG